MNHIDEDNTVKFASGGGVYSGPYDGKSNTGNGGRGTNDTSVNGAGMGGSGIVIIKVYTNLLTSYVDDSINTSLLLKGGLGGGGGNIENNGKNHTGGGGSGKIINNKSGNGGSGLVMIKLYNNVELLQPTNLTSTLNFYDINKVKLNNINIYKYDELNDNGNGQTEYSLIFDEDLICDILIVAGGGGGGMDMGGGGGGGGVIYIQDYVMNKNVINTILVGKGGKGAPGGNSNGQPANHRFTISAENGKNSVFNDNIAIGGGYGSSSRHDYQPNYGKAGNGGSGGGASGYSNTGNKQGLGVIGQGNDGGRGNGSHYSGGGGGAGEIGGSGKFDGGAKGGDGILINILDESYYWGGGGGGSGYSVNGGNGGLGGGGGGAVGTTIGGLGYNNGNPGGGGSKNSQTNKPGGDGGQHTGGGGGGGSHYNRTNKGGDGGSGIVIVKSAYKYKETFSIEDVKITSSLIEYKESIENNLDNIYIFKYNKKYDNDDGNTKYNLIINKNIFVNILMVGGGGAGGLDNINNINAGGGGGGLIYLENILLEQNDYKVEIGRGGKERYENGKDTTFSFLKTNAIGGGAGGINELIGKDGGCGGGGNINGKYETTLIFNYNNNDVDTTKYKVKFDDLYVEADILIVGGGGGGGAGGGGGGGGGILFKKSIRLLNKNLIINVGKGGLGSDHWQKKGNNGIESSIILDDIKYIGYGGGGGGSVQNQMGENGGNGGGGYRDYIGGNNIQIEYDGWESYGNKGGEGIYRSTNTNHMGGGGGAGSKGYDGIDDGYNGYGGKGKEFISYFGSNVGDNGYFSGGGGGNVYNDPTLNIVYGNGGSNLYGGGGNGGLDSFVKHYNSIDSENCIEPTNGLDNTGGGGGGGLYNGNGGNGGSGIVIIKLIKSSNSQPIIVPEISSYTLSFIEYWSWYGLGYISDIIKYDDTILKENYRQGYNGNLGGGGANNIGLENYNSNIFNGKTNENNSYFLHEFNLYNNALFQMNIFQLEDQVI